MAKNIEEINNFISINCYLDNNTLYTKTLYSASGNKIMAWRGAIYVLKEGEKHYSRDAILPAFYFTEYGYEGGKLTISEPTQIDSGKNIGKKNETKPLEQAISEIKSKFNKKVREGCVLDKSALLTPSSRILPMLARDAKKYMKKIVYPIFAQPKLDGVHATFVCFKNKTDFYYRGLTDAIHEHITNAMPCIPDIYVCGELFAPGLTRQVIAGICNKKKKNKSDVKLEFHIFDAFRAGGQESFKERFEWARDIVAKAASPYIKLIEYSVIDSEQELNKYYEEKIKSYEGIMIRAPDSPYEPDKRAKGLMKYKPRYDAEFKIIGVAEGEGKDKGKIIFIAIVPTNNKTFSVRPKWTDKKRIKAWEEKDKFIGLMATIEYDSMNDGVPQQPVLINFI
jgi:DNA ligase-1